MDECVPFWWLLGRTNAGYMHLPPPRHPYTSGTSLSLLDDGGSSLLRPPNRRSVSTLARVTLRRPRRRGNSSANEKQRQASRGGGTGGTAANLAVVGAPQSIYRTSVALRDPRNMKEPPLISTADVDAQAERRKKGLDEATLRTRRIWQDQCRRRNDTMKLYRRRLAHGVQTEKRRIGRPASSGQSSAPPGPRSPTSSDSRDQQAGIMDYSQSPSANRSVGAADGFYFFRGDPTVESVSATETLVSPSWGLLLGSEKPGPLSSSPGAIQSFRLASLEGPLKGELRTSLGLDPYQTQGHFRGSTKSFPPLFRSYHAPSPSADINTGGVEWWAGVGEGVPAMASSPSLLADSGGGEPGVEEGGGGEEGLQLHEEAPKVKDDARLGMLISREEGLLPDQSSLVRGAALIADLRNCANASAPLQQDDVRESPAWSPDPHQEASSTSTRPIPTNLSTNNQKSPRPHHTKLDISGAFVSCY